MGKIPKKYRIFFLRASLSDKGLVWSMDFEFPFNSVSILLERNVPVAGLKLSEHNSKSMLSHKRHHHFTLVPSCLSGWGSSSVHINVGKKFRID